MTDRKTQEIATIDPAVCAQHAGQYLIQPDYVVKVAAENGKLFVEAPDTLRTEVYPASPTMFFIRSLDCFLLFKPNEDGQIDRFQLHVQGRDSIAKRIK